MKALRTDLETQVQESEQERAALDRDENSRAQRVGSLEEQLRKRLDTVDTQLTETTQELDHARSEQLRMKTEMADLLRLEARSEQAAKLEADMLREHIAEVDVTNAAYRERNAAIEAEGRVLAAQFALFHAHQ